MKICLAGLLLTLFTGCGLGEKELPVERPVATCAEGELLGSCRIEPMEGDVPYSIHETQVKPVQGKHALVLVFKAADGETKDEDLMDLEWLAFENKVYKR